jgi:hypothetical protein
VSATATGRHGTRNKPAAPDRARGPARPAGPGGAGRDGGRRAALLAAAGLLLAVAAELPLLRVFGSPGLRIVLLAAPLAVLASTAVRAGCNRLLGAGAPAAADRSRRAASSPTAVLAGFAAGLLAGALPGLVTAAADPFGPASLAARLQDALTDGWYRLLSVPVPVPFTRSFTDLPVLLAALLATVIGLCAGSRRPAVAVAPAVVGFAGLLVLGVDGPVTGTTLTGGFALAVAIFLLVAAPARGGARRRVATGAVAGVGLIAATVLVAGALHPGPPYNPRAQVRPQVDIQALQDPMALLSSLLQTPKVPVLTARLSGALVAQPRNWVLLTYDDYDGAGWQAPGDARPAVTSGVAPDSIGTGVASVSAASPLTLLPHPPMVLSSSPADLAYAPDSELLAAPSAIRAYTVRVSVGRPSAAALRLAAVPSGVPATLTAVPSCVPPALRTLASQLSSVATLPGEQVERLQQYLSSGPFRYDPSAAPGEACASISAMLTRRDGTSAQFATAFALVARLLGIPARVAVGYSPGTLSGGVTTVTDGDAYAWPEVELTGIGWLDVDPTPTSKDAGQQPPREKQPAIQQLRNATPPPSVHPGQGRVAPGPLAAPGLGLTDQVLLGILGCAALALLWLAAVWAVGAHRRARRRRSADPVARALGAWDELLVALEQAGVRISGRSAPAVAADAGALLPAQGRRAGELAELAERALYGLVTAADAEAAWRLSDAARRPFAAAASRPARLRRLFIPAGQGARRLARSARHGRR